jgi:HlyD family secretion protein
MSPGAGGFLESAERPPLHAVIGNTAENRPVWKWIIGSVVAMIALAGGGVAAAAHFGLFEKLSGLTPAQSGIAVRLVEAEEGDLVRRISVPGHVEPYTMVDISAQVSARIIALPFNEGDDVKAGDVVCRLDAEDLQARLDAAESRLKAEEARLAGAKASARLAELDLNRIAELHSTGDVPGAERDRAQATFDQAVASVKASEASLEMIRAEIAEQRKALEYAVLESPIDGTITSLNLEVGEQVLGTLQNAGTVIMQICDLRKSLVRARIDETNVSFVEEGQSADIYLTSYPERVFQGTVERVRLVRETYRDGTNYVEAEIGIQTNPEDRLMIGLTANADIAVQELNNIVKIPSQAVIDKPIEDLPDDVVEASPFINRRKLYTQIVFRMVDGKAVATPVQTGPSDPTDTVVLGGLSGGDVIVAGPRKIIEELDHDAAIRDEKAPDPAKAASGRTEAGAAESTDQTGEGDQAAESPGDETGQGG